MAGNTNKYQKVKARLGYWCLCMSAAHASQLRKIVHDATLRMMLDPQSPIYNVKVAKLMKTVVGVNDGSHKKGGPQLDDEEKPPKKTRRRRRSLATARRRRRVSKRHPKTQTTTI